MLRTDTKKLQKKILIYLRQLKVIDVIFAGAFLMLIAFFILTFARSDRSIEIRVKVTDQNAFLLKTEAPTQYVYSFHQGDVERNEIGKVIAEIGDINRFQTNPDTYTMYLDLNIKANYNPLKKQYTYKGRPIIFGQDLEFNFGNTKVNGLIVSFPGYVEPEKKPLKLGVTVQVRSESRLYSDVYGMPKYYENIVKEGDIVSDNQGQQIIKVLEVKSNPAKRTIISPNNQSITINDQNLIDLFYTLEVNAYEVDGKLYAYDFIPVQVGNVLPMTLGNVSLWPTIISYQKL